MNRPCPACPDGNEWNSNGPTGRACRVCDGKAYLGEVEPEEDDDNGEDCNVEDSYAR